MNKKTLQNIRKRFYEESPLCRNCGTFTIYPDSEDNGVSKSNTATIQHTKPKTHSNYHESLELWCYKCNEEDAYVKNQFKIFSREEMLYDIISKLGRNFNQLEGTYIIDGYACTYKKHKLIKERHVIDFKFECLDKYMDYFIKKLPLQKGQTPISFEAFYKKQIKGEFVFKQHHLGDGWYQRDFFRKELEIFLSKQK